MIRTSSTPDLTASDRKTVEDLAALLPSRWPVDSLVLYGSKARGDDTPESDIDLLVLTGRPLAPEEIGELRAVSRRIGLTPELAVSFDGLYAQRLDADYGDFIDIPREQVANTLETARRFVAVMEAAVRGNGQ